MKRFTDEQIKIISDNILKEHPELLQKQGFKNWSKISEFVKFIILISPFVVIFTCFLMILRIFGVDNLNLVIVFLSLFNIVGYSLQFYYDTGNDFLGFPVTGMFIWVMITVMKIIEMTI